MKVVLQNLTKIFPSRNKNANEEVVAVNDFTFEIPDGKLIGLLGPSGCGKSTTLYMICGLQKPSSGQIFFGEDDVTELAPENRGVGLVFQNYALYPHMTVRQNILFPLQNLKGADKLSKEEMLARAEEAARLVQIDNLMDRKPHELSGGQQQRVAIARALVKMPRVLLLDEPLSNLDARLRLQTREEIKRIQRETGITTVFVTHDQEEAMSISDMIVVMKLGVVQQIGAPQEVYDNPVNLFVAKFLGTPPINVFKGRIENGVVYIGDDAVLTIKDKPEYHQAMVEVEPVVEAPAEGEAAQAAPEAPAEEPAPAAKKNGLVEFFKNLGGKIKGLFSKKKNEPVVEEEQKPAVKKELREVTSKPIYVGIRPEGFIYNTKGKLHCALSNVEVMGRDVSIVSTNPAAVSPIVRSIIDADSGVDRTAETVSYDIKPNKIFLFDGDTEERIYFEVK